MNENKPKNEQDVQERKASWEEKGEKDEKSASEEGRDDWIGGAVLIAIGVILLLANLTELRLYNWWALFILIPAIGSLTDAWKAYQRSDKQLTARVYDSFFAGVAILFVALIFLFDLDWGRVWPAFLIIAGASMLLRALAQ